MSISAQGPRGIVQGPTGAGDPPFDDLTLVRWNFHDNAIADVSQSGVSLGHVDENAQRIGVDHDQ